jgi:hypothetical protein
MSIRLIFGLLVAMALATSSARAKDDPAKDRPVKPAVPANEPKDKPAATAPQSPDEIALRAALKTLAKALQDGDRDQIRRVIYAASPTERKMVDAMATMAAEIAHLYKAAAKAFGDEQAKALTGDLGAELTRIEQAKVSIDGETATVVYKPGEPAPKQADLASADPAAPLQLSKIDGRWQVPMAKLSKDATPEQIEQRLADLDVQTKVIAEITAEIAQGKYKNIDAVAEAWQAKVMQALTPPRKPGDEKGHKAAGEQREKPAGDKPAPSPPAAHK